MRNFGSVGAEAEESHLAVSLVLNAMPINFPNLGFAPLLVRGITGPAKMTCTHSQGARGEIPAVWFPIASVAQSVEQLTLNQLVLGSNPSRGTTFTVKDLGS